VSEAQAAKVLAMMMKGVQAFEARDLKMAMAAMSMAEELNAGGSAALNKALAEARKAIRRDDRMALMLTMAQAAAAARPMEVPPVKAPPVAKRPAPVVRPPAVEAPPATPVIVETVAVQTPIKAENVDIAAVAAPPVAPAAKPVSVEAKQRVEMPVPVIEPVETPKPVEIPPTPVVTVPAAVEPAPPAKPARAEPKPARAEPKLAKAEPKQRTEPILMPRPIAETMAPAEAAPAPPAPASRAILLLGAAEHALAHKDKESAMAALDHAILSSRAHPEEDDLAAAEAFIRLGGVLAEAQSWFKAREALNEGLDIKMRALGKSNRRIAADLVLLSYVCERLGDYQEARTLAERGLSIRRLQSNVEPGDLAASLVQLGNVALALEEFGDAAGCFREALAIGRDIGAGDEWIAGCLDQLALAVARLESKAAARALHEQAFALRRPMLPADHPDIGRSLMYIGGFLLDAGAHEEAATHVNAALEIFEAQGPAEIFNAAQCLETLAVLNVRRQDLEPGRKLLLNAVERLRAAFGPEQNLVMKFETELAFLTLFTGDLHGAAKIGYATLWRARAPHHVNLRRDLWYLLSQLAAVRREWAAAIVFGKLAANAVAFQPGGVTSLETPLQRLFAARHGDVFRHLAGLLAKADRLPEASRVLAMLKEDELFDLLRRNPALDPRVTQIHLSSTEATWEAEGNDILRALADAGRDGLTAGEADRRRLEADRRFETWLKTTQTRCAPPADFQSGHAGLAPLGARVGLLQMIAGPQSLHLLLSATEFQVACEVEVGAPALRRLVLAFRVCVETQGEEVAALGAELFGYLIAPVLPVLQEWGLKTLLIGAEGWLRYVPFPALHDGETFLAERFATVMLTEAVQDATGFRRDGLTISAMGNASAAAEMRALVRGERSEGLFPGSVAADALFGAAQLSEALADTRLVHVASRLVLDAETTADSYLTLGDGTALRLNALAQPPYYFRDVVQMAFTDCQTAPADSAGDGSELEAMGALLRWRGVGVVLACHWRPETGPVVAQITAFYAQRREGKPASAALNAAQRQILAGPAAYRHPYFWAPFFVLGGVE
jgi:tetratricopeptide (TPR) repeat protein